MRNRLRDQGWIILAVLAILCGAITEVRAGTITASDIVPGCAGTLIIIPSSGNPIDIAKDFSSICNKDIVFTVMNSGAVGTQSIIDQVTNLTAFTWYDFHMRLGFGVGNAFLPIPANCAVVGFATLPLPTSTVFQLQGVNSNAINFEGGGTVPPNGMVQFNFNINADDLRPCIPAGSQLADGKGYTFTLRETPSVPEPATMLLLGTGLAGVAIKTRKRLKNRKS